jgi:acyl transferase domain-containing protein
LLARAGKKSSSGAEAGRREFLRVWGANGHIVLEEFDTPLQRQAQPPTQEIILLSAKSEERLQAHAANLKKWFETELAGSNRPATDSLLHDLACTLQIGREPFKVRLAFVASGLEELIAKLAAYINHEPEIGGLFVGNVSAHPQKSSDPDRAWKDGEVLQAVIESREYTR